MSDTMNDWGIGVIINPDEIKEQFEKEKSSSNQQSWRIGIGKKLSEAKLRILPNPHRPSQYYTVYYHYNVKDYGLFCLKKNNQKECPICDLFERQKQELIKEQADFLKTHSEEEMKKKFKEEWKVLFGIEAKKRYYVPVINRVDAIPEVKYLDMSETVKNLVIGKIIEKPIYLHPLQGRDWLFKYIPKQGSEFGDVTVDRDDDPSPILSNGNIEEIKKLIQGIPDLMKLIPVPTFNEINSALMEQINKKDEETPVTAGDGGSVPVEISKTQEEVKEELNSFFNQSDVK